MGISPQLAHGSLRLTVGRGTTGDEVERTIGAVREAVTRLRAMVGPRPTVASVS